MDLSQRIWNVATVIILLLLLLSGRLVYWQVVRSDLQPVLLNPLGGGAAAGDRLLKEGLTQETLDQLESLPQPVVQRTVELLQNITRGTIYDRNGRALAYNVTDEEGNTFRFYSEPSLAATVGYVNALNLGIIGAEQAFNESLLGLDRLDSQLDQLVHRPITGSDVYLTIDSRVQREAAAALNGRAGAIVVLEPSGAILAMASTPTFDPNQILDGTYLDSLLNCQTPDCAGALLNRNTQGLYPPGSTWKIGTLVAALDSGQVTPETVFDFGEPRRNPDGSIYYVYEVDGAVIVDPNHPESRLNLIRSFAVSANAAFARMGDEMPPEVMRDYAARMGFSRDEGDEPAPPIEIGALPSQLANDPQSIFDNNVLRAATAFGQGELLTTPLNMALMVAGVVNGGSIPAPHLLDRVIEPDGDVGRLGRTNPWITGVMRPETAQQAAAIMATAVREGSGVFAAVSGATVGGKTGTAEVGSGQAPHAWFVGFAHENDRTVIIAVIVENGGQGADVAAPLFARVARVALREVGEPVEEVVSPP